MHQCRGQVPLRCKVFARLNNCANGDEVDVLLVQTQKNAKSLLCSCWLHIDCMLNFIILLFYFLGTTITSHATQTICRTILKIKVIYASNLYKLPFLSMNLWCAASHTKPFIHPSQLSKHTWLKTHSPPTYPTSIPIQTRAPIFTHILTTSKTFFWNINQCKWN